MKLIKSIVMAGGLLFVAGQAVHAQEQKKAGEATPAEAALSVVDLRGLGAGLVIIGAALGIGILAKGAVESMARQPEIAGNIQIAMIIAAALIEGVTFFALLIIMIKWPSPP